MRFEIREHWEKLKKISRLADDALTIAYEKLLARLTFVNEELIPPVIWKNAEAVVAGIDLDDTDFVALTKYLRGGLWTGDKRLYEGLKAKRLRSIYNTSDMLKLRARLLAR